MSNYKNSNTYQAFWVAFGSIISYGFILISSMVLSRYFSKGDYGTYRQIMYVYNTLLVVFTLGLPKAYSFFLPRIELEAAKDTINKITFLFFFLGMCFSLALFFGSSTIAQFLKNPELDYGIKLFSIVPIFMLPTMGLDGILATYKKTQYLAIYKGLSSFFQLVSVAVPVIFFHGGYVSAILGFTMSSFLICIIALYLKNMPVRKEKKVKTNIKYKDIFSFSLPLLYASLWGIIMNSADQFFISRYFGKETFAEFSNGWMDLPFITMIVTATSTVLLPVFSKIIHQDNATTKEQILKIWKNVIEKTIKLIYPLLIYCWIFADILLVVLFGESYQESGNYFRIRLIYNLFTVVAYAPLLLALGATRYYARGIFFGALSVIILELIVVKYFGSPYAIAIVSVVCHIAVAIYMLKYVARYLNTSIFNLFPAKLILVIVFISTPILLSLYYILVVQFSLSGLMVLSISAFTFSILFLLIAHKLKINYLLIIKSVIG